MVFTYKRFHVSWMKTFFHFLSSADAKTDFMKIIRQTIRESVRKMTLPNGNQIRNSYVPYGGRRLECLNSNIRTLSKKRGGKPSQTEPDRHSLEFQENMTSMLDQSEPVFRTRSKTLGDLTDENSLEEAGPVSRPTHLTVDSSAHLTTDRQSMSSSNSSLSVSSRTSAKLTQASANPVSFTSNVPREINSPIWKPRNESNLVYLKDRPSSSVVNSSQVSTVHSDELDVVSVKDTPISLPPVLLKDTECWYCCPYYQISYWITSLIFLYLPDPGGVSRRDVSQESGDRYIVDHCLHSSISSFIFRTPLEYERNVKEVCNIFSLF